MAAVLLVCVSQRLFAQEMNATQPAPVNVTGVVVNAITQAPVPRALVQLGGRAILTDHDGKFEFDQFAQQYASLQVTKPGYYFSLEPMNNGSRMLTGSELDAPLTLRLYPEALLTGTITGPDGSPLRGVPVSAMRSVFDENGHRWLPVGLMVQTNIRGEFRITVPPGAYRLRTLHITRPFDRNVVMPLVFPDNSSGGGLSEIKLRGGEEQHFDLHPMVGPVHTVWIASQPGEPGVPMLQVCTAAGNVFPVGAHFTAGSPFYGIDLPDGAYRLTATKYSANGQQIAETNVTVAGGDVSGVTLRFQPIPTVPVEIRVDPDTSDNDGTSTPPNPYALGLILQGDSQEMGMNVSGPQMKNGEILFQVRPGSYRLVARNVFSRWYVESASYGDRDLLRQDLTVGLGSESTPIEITVSDQSGTLSGTACSESITRDCRVYLLPVTPSANLLIAAGVTYIGSDSSDQAFYSTHLAPGTYRAIAFDQRYSFDPHDPNALQPYASHERTITIHAGEKATLDLDAVTEAEMRP